MDIFYFQQYKLILFCFKLKNSIQKLIEIKMNKLKINLNRYDLQKTQMDTFSYVLINPSSDFQLQSGDLVYLLKPGKSNC
jgi:hypothetical protein